MTINAATPYIIPVGKAEQAIALYQKALGAKVESLQRFGDMNPDYPEPMRSRVMHAVLKVGEATLMLSDGSSEETDQKGGPVHIAIQMNDVAECHRAFNALAASGKATQPLIDAPWGALFGIADDEFGVSWMFNCTK